MYQRKTRRSFSKCSAFTGVASALHEKSALTNDLTDNAASVFDNKKNLVFLFQGDSIKRFLKT